MIDFDEQDHDFADILYQQWSKTTRAEDSYWMPVGGTTVEEEFRVVAVVRDQHGEEFHVTVATGLFSEADADFICGLHGALPDLVRRLHDAIDEASRKDEANDIAQGQLAEAYMEIQGLKEEIDRLERQTG